MTEHLDNIDEPDYPMMTRVRVRDVFGDYPGRIVYKPRWTAIGWEARVLRDDLPGEVARWVPADRVTLRSAVDRLGELAP